MYCDYEMSLKDRDENDLPRVLLSLRLRPRKYLTNDEMEHKGKVAPEVEEHIRALLEQVPKPEHMSGVVDGFLREGCKCEQIELAINLVESAIMWDDHDPTELMAAEECLKTLSDLRVGAGLLWLWQNRDSRRPLWRERSLDARELRFRGQPVVHGPAECTVS